MTEKPPCKTISTLYKYDTEYSADSVEWCPHDPFQNYFVCANYQIQESEDESPCSRTGRILLFSISSTKGLTLHQTIETAAVLDQKWCPNQINQSGILLGVVNAQKTLQIYQLNISTSQLELVTYHKIESNDEKDTLLLSLDWSSAKIPTNQPEIVVSDSRGNVHLFLLSNNELFLQNTWHAHGYEAWICGFYCWDPNIIFTGGDDSIFLKFDKRVGFNEPVAKNRSSHEAGVTAFHSNVSHEFTVASGSYDSNVRIWDTRNLKTPQRTIQMPDTLWRLKYDPFRQTHLLAACMRGGVHVINTTTSEIEDSYYEHENIAYGIDWCHLPSQTTQSTYQCDAILGSCSFYDHLLCISTFNFNKTI